MYLTLEEVESLLRSIQETSSFPVRDYAMFLVFLQCGCRFSELLGMRTQSLNLKERTLQEIAGHSSVATTQIYTHVTQSGVKSAMKKHPNGEVFNAPIDLTLSEIDVVQPDLVYVPGDSPIVEERRLNGTPRLVVEVVSPASGRRDRITKLRIYLKAGVPHYWLVDQQAEIIEAYALQQDAYVLRASAQGGESFTHPDFPGLAFDPAVLWEK